MIVEPPGSSGGFGNGNTLFFWFFITTVMPRVWGNSKSPNCGKHRLLKGPELSYARRSSLGICRFRLDPKRTWFAAVNTSTTQIANKNIRFSFHLGNRANQSTSFVWGSKRKWPPCVDTHRRFLRCCSWLTPHGIV
jgi:hypothetical protein